VKFLTLDCELCH